MDASTWLGRYAEALGTAAPSAAEMDSLLALAGVAAHTSERIAAPLACWLSARAGVAPEQALALARELPGVEPADAR